MYLYYEHHRDGRGKIVLTELRLSSRGDGRLEIWFWNLIENTTFEACKPLLKWPPVSNYSYDPALKVWSYFGQYGVSSTYGETVISKIEAVVKLVGQSFTAIEVEDLAGQAVNNYVDLSGKRKKIRDEEFFYNHGQAVNKPALTREEIEKKLVVLLGSSTADKKSYRAAALRLHPDRNDGDGSKMSELNMLWQLWNTELKAQEVTSA